MRTRTKVFITGHVFLTLLALFLLAVVVKKAQGSTQEQHPRARVHLAARFKPDTRGYDGCVLYRIYDEVQGALYYTSCPGFQQLIHGR